MAKCKYSLTVEQKAALYDQITSNNRALVELYSRLFQRLRQGFFNEFNNVFTAKNGKKIRTFGKPLDKLAEELANCKDDSKDIAFWLACLCDDLHKIGLKLDKICDKGAPDIHTLVKNNFDCKSLAKIAKRLTEDQRHGLKNITEFRSKCPLDLERIAFMMSVFFFEYDFHKQYPGDEQEIYKDAFRSCLLPILAKVGVMPDRDSMLGFIGSCAKKYKN